MNRLMWPVWNGLRTTSGPFGDAGILLPTRWPLWIAASPGTPCSVQECLPVLVTSSSIAGAASEPVAEVARPHEGAAAQRGVATPHFGTLAVA